MHGVELRIVSSLGQNVMVDITPDNLSKGMINIGHFHEKNGTHYAVLNEENQNRKDEPQGESDVQLESPSNIVDIRNDGPQRESDTQLGSRSSN